MFKKKLYSRSIKLKENNMTIEKQQNGSLLISDIVNNQYIKQVYYFYTKKDAIKLFRKFRKEKTQ